MVLTWRDGEVRLNIPEIWRFGISDQKNNVLDMKEFVKKEPDVIVWQADDESERQLSLLA